MTDPKALPCPDPERIWLAPEPAPAPEASPDTGEGG